MFTISNQQLNTIVATVEQRNVDELIETLEKEYPQHYVKFSKEAWPPYLKKHFKIAHEWEIESLPNQFLFVLATLEYPHYFTGDLPQWMKDEMEWPARQEDEKMVILFKELIKRSRENGINKGE